MNGSGLDSFLPDELHALAALAHDVGAVGGQASEEVSDKISIYQRRRRTAIVLFGAFGLSQIGHWISILVSVCFEQDATGTSTALANVMRNGWLAYGALSGNLVKKLCRDFARTSKRKAHFCPISSAKPRFAFAVRHLSCCERPCIKLRKTIFRASVRHVTRRETCLTVK